MTLSLQEKIDGLYAELARNEDEVRGDDLFKSLCLLLAEKYKDILEDKTYGQERIIQGKEDPIPGRDYPQT